MSIKDKVQALNSQNVCRIGWIEWKSCQDEIYQVVKAIEQSNLVGCLNGHQEHKLARSEGKLKKVAGF